MRKVCKLIVTIACLAATVSLRVRAAAEPILQQFVGNVSQSSRTPPELIRSDAVTIRPPNEVDHNIVISGQDKQRRPWVVHLQGDEGAGFSLAWTADLDRDGTNDLIFLIHHYANGSCLDRSRLVTILFDSDGRPSPWAIDGYFNADFSSKKDSGKGILDLGDWSNNGRAELLQLDCLNDLYRLTDVYEANKGVWRRVPKEQRSKYESTYRNVARRGNRKQPLRAQEASFVPDYSNDPGSGTTGKITAFIPRDGAYEGCGILQYTRVEDGRIMEISKEEKQKVRERCEDHFVLENGTVCFTTPALVLALPDATEAVMDGASVRWGPLLKQIIAEELPVTLTGQLEERACSPTLIWANKP